MTDYERGYRQAVKDLRGSTSAPAHALNLIADKLLRFGDILTGHQLLNHKSFGEPVIALRNMAARFKYVQSVLADFKNRESIPKPDQIPNYRRQVKERYRKLWDASL